MQLPARQSADAPTVLLAVGGERLARSLIARIRGLRVMVHEATLETVVQTAFVTAPDLVVLGGAATVDGGHALLERLGEHHATSILPVVLIGEGGGATNARAALRHGIVAIIDRSGGVERMARTIKALAGELPERTGETSGMLNENELAHLVGLITESHRVGLLSVTDETSAPLMHMVLRGDRPVEQTIADLARRLRGLEREGRGPLRYSFHEAGRARVAELSSSEGPAEVGQLAGRRIMLIERNAARADLLVQALRGAGSTVVVTTGAGDGLDLAREVMPEVIVVYDRAADDWGAETLRLIRRDPLLCWASLLVVDTQKVWSRKRPDIGSLGHGIIELIQPDLELTTRVRARDSVEARLEVVGPARTLRALAAARIGLEVSVLHPRVKVELTIADGKIGAVRARALGGRSKPAEGPGALATLLHLPSGRVSISRGTARGSQVFTPLSEALAAAAPLDPTIRRSAPPPLPADSKPRLPQPHALPPIRQRPARPPEGSQVARLVDRLERLLAETEDETLIGEAPIIPPPAPAREPSSIAFDDDEETTQRWSPALAAMLRQRLLHEQAKRDKVDAAKRAQRSRREPTMQLGSRPDVSEPMPELSLSDMESPLALNSVTEEFDDETSQEVSVDVQLEDLDAGRSADRSEAAGAAQEPPLDERTTDAGPPPSELSDATIPDEPSAFSAPVEPPRLNPSAPLTAEAPAPALTSEELPTGRPSRLWVAAAVCAMAFFGGGGGAWWLRRELNAGRADARRTIAPAPSDRSESRAASAPPEPGGRTAGAPSGDNPTGLVGGRDESQRDESQRDESQRDESQRDESQRDGIPTAEEPLEGAESDLSLAAFGVQPEQSRRSAAALNRRARHFLVRANRSRAQGELTRARQQYLEILAFNPRNVPATVGLVRVFLRADEPANAVLFAQRVTRISGAAASYVLLADAFTAAGAAPAARRALERALEIDRTHRGARRRLRRLTAR